MDEENYNSENYDYRSVTKYDGRLRDSARKSTRRIYLLIAFVLLLPWLLAVLRVAGCMKGK